MIIRERIKIEETRVILSDIEGQKRAQGRVCDNTPNPCQLYEDTNPNLREEYCNSPKSKRCICKRDSGEKGMFSDPRGGQHYFS